MESRIEKYYKQDLSEFQRVKKNNELYKNIYGSDDDFSNLPVSDNFVELNISDIKKGITSREEYKKAKELGNITNTRVKKINEDKVEIKQERVYDINKMLEKARMNNKYIEDDNDLVSDKYLKSLEEFTKEEKIELIKEKQDMKDEYNKELEEKMKETASLSLDILSDLKPSEDTIITAPIKEELKDNDDAFYSGTYSFSKEDFEEKNDDFSDIESSNLTLKIVLLSFGLLICVAMIILLYYHIG